MLEARQLLSAATPLAEPPVAGAVKVAGDFYYVRHYTELAGRIYFEGTDREGTALWVADGSEAVLLARGGLFHDLTPVGDTLFFMSGSSLWKSDGTVAGTERVRKLTDFFPVTASLPPLPGITFSLTDVGGRLFFRKGTQLWTSDGTDAGTTMIADIGLEADISGLRHLTAVGDRLFFVAEGGWQGTEIWVSDGTATGTRRVADVQLGSLSPSVTAMTGFDGHAYFMAGGRLWRTAGSEEGTVLLHEGFVDDWPRDRLPTEFTAANGLLFFVADDGVHGRELWRTDGTPEGTVLVKDIRPGSEGSRPASLASIDDALFFSADDGVHGRELWKSDGTEAGTVLVRDITPGPQSTNLWLNTTDSAAFMVIDDGHVRRIWTSDGSESGTYPLTVSENSSVVAAAGENVLYSTGTPLGYFDNGEFVTPFDVALWWGPVPVGQPLALPPMSIQQPDGVALYLPEEGKFAVRYQPTPGAADVTFPLGPENADWVPLMGDWNGDGLKTPGLFDPQSSTFYLKDSLAGGMATSVVQFGPAGAGWKPIVGDWNGDGRDRPGLYSGEVFFLINTFHRGPADIVVGFGPAGVDWKPLAGDWNGDGRDTIGLYSDQGAFFLKNDFEAGAADWHFGYGPAEAGVVPLAGDWNGDGNTTVAVYRDGSFFLRNEHAPGPADIVFGYGSGDPASIPLAGPWTKVLDESALDAVIAAALERFEQSGVDDDTLDLLAGMTFAIGGVPAPYHLTTTGTTYLHPTAAGQGWFFDPTPGADEEYMSTDVTGRLAAIEGTSAANRVDLLTAVLNAMQIRAAAPVIFVPPHLKFDVGVREVPAVETLDEWFFDVPG